MKTNIYLPLILLGCVSNLAFSHEGVTVSIFSKKSSDGLETILQCTDTAKFSKHLKRTAHTDNTFTYGSNVFEQFEINGTLTYQCYDKLASDETKIVYTYDPIKFNTRMYDADTFSIIEGVPDKFIQKSTAVTAPNIDIKITLSRDWDLAFKHTSFGTATFSYIPNYDGTPMKESRYKCEIINKAGAKTPDAICEISPTDETLKSHHIDYQLPSSNPGYYIKIIAKSSIKKTVVFGEDKGQTYYIPYIPQPKIQLIPSIEINDFIYDGSNGKASINLPFEETDRITCKILGGTCHIKDNTTISFAREADDTLASVTVISTDDEKKEVILAEKQLREWSATYVQQIKPTAPSFVEIHLAPGVPSSEGTFTCIASADATCEITRLGSLIVAEVNNVSEGDVLTIRRTDLKDETGKPYNQDQKITVPKLKQ